MLRRLVLPVLALLAVSIPAHAVESLVGTYDAKLRCKGAEAGVKVSSKIVGTMRVIEAAVGIYELDFQSGGERQLTDVPLLAVATADADKPERGRAAALSCNSGAGKLQAAALSGDVSTQVGSEKADLKGTLVVMAGEGQSLVCSVKAKRTSVTPPPDLMIEADCQAALE
jgi:hypothetical protein